MLKSNRTWFIIHQAVKLLNTAVVCCRHEKFLNSSAIWRCSLKMRRKKTKSINKQIVSQRWFLLRLPNHRWPKYQEKSAICTCTVLLLLLGWTCMAVLMFLWEKDHFSTVKPEMFGNTVSKTQIKKSFDTLLLWIFFLKWSIITILQRILGNTLLLRQPWKTVEPTLPFYFKFQKKKAAI